MMKRSAPLEALPFWPRYLTREEAARYTAVSVDVWDDEVRRGLWPPARKRGLNHGKLTWDRRLIDNAADRDSGIIGVGEPAATGPPDSAEEAAHALEMIHATSTRNRLERRAPKAR